MAQHRLFGGLRRIIISPVEVLLSQRGQKAAEIFRSLKALNGHCRSGERRGQLSPLFLHLHNTADRRAHELSGPGPGVQNLFSPASEQGWIGEHPQVRVLSRQKPFIQRLLRQKPFPAGPEIIFQGQSLRDLSLSPAFQRVFLKEPFPKSLRRPRRPSQDASPEDCHPVVNGKIAPSVQIDVAGFP